MVDSETRDRPDDSQRLAIVRERMLSFWWHMDVVGWTLHPMAIEDMSEIAQALEIDESLMPTEARELRMRAGQ